MAGNGGRRPGAGRKPVAFKRVLYASPLRSAEQSIVERLPWLISQMFALAEGVEVQATDRRGQTRIYTTAPDRQAIEYLVDRVMGKPVQPIDVSKRIQDIAAAEGLTEEEAAEAVAEVQRMMAVGRGARS